MYSLADSYIRRSRLAAKQRAYETPLPVRAAVSASGTQGSQGPDRITRTVYDAESRLIAEQRAYGTSLQQNYAVYSYSPNGLRLSVTDANGNRTELRYDGHSRQTRWVFPSPTTAGQVNESDYEAYTYDAAGNRTSYRRRDGSTLTFTYDNLNRLVTKTVPERSGLDPSHTRDVYYGYDVGNRQLYARFDSATGAGITNSYDSLGRLNSATSNVDGTSRTLDYLYDAGSRRIRITHPGGTYFTTDYAPSSDPTFVRENGAASGVGVLATYGYDSNGRRNGLTSGNGAVTTYNYDALSRLSQLDQNLAGTTYDLTLGFTRNAASQIAVATRSNYQFSFQGTANATTSYNRNGLNQYTQVAGATQSYDANGNLTGDGTRTFGYDIENRLVTASSGITMHYDPLGRLYEIAASSGTTRFLYDGDNLVAEYDGNGTGTRRYAHGTGSNEPLVWYELGDSTERRFLHADERGSIIGVTNNSGTMIGGGNYDEHGQPQSGAISGRFGYTGQMWLPELGLWYYRARVYNPTLGRFMQTDPVGYQGGINLYAYVGNDPVNLADPSGTCARAAGGGCGEADPYFGEVIGNDARNPVAPEPPPESQGQVYGMATGQGSENGGEGGRAIEGPVTGSAADLVVAGIRARFALNEAGRWAQYIADLAEYGRQLTAWANRIPTISTLVNGIEGMPRAPRSPNLQFSVLSTHMRSHGSRHTGWPELHGSPSQVNQASRQFLDSVIDDPERVIYFRHHALRGYIYDIRARSGLGARFGMDLNYINLLDPGF